MHNIFHRLGHESLGNLHLLPPTVLSTFYCFFVVLPYYYHSQSIGVFLFSLVCTIFDLFFFLFIFFLVAIVGCDSAVGGAGGVVLLASVVGVGGFAVGSAGVVIGFVPFTYWRWWCCCWWFPLTPSTSTAKTQHDTVAGF